MKIGTKGERLVWHHVKWVQVRSENPESIFFNYDFDEANFIEVNIKAKTRKAGRPAKDQEDLSYRYCSKLPVSIEKKNDLLSLCKSGVIPEQHHHYFETLKTDQKTRNRLPMPDILESDCDTDDN